MYYDDKTDKEPGKSLSESLIEGLRKCKKNDKPAQVDALTGETMSFCELLEQSVRAAEGWKSLGLGVGDIVAVFSRNNSQLFPAVLGGLFNGCTLAFVTTTSTKTELKHALNLCSPKAMLSESSNLKLSMQVAPDCLHVDLGNDEGSTVPGVETYQSLLQLGAHADPDTYQPAPILDRIAHVSCILYSSGTTGAPKGVMLRDQGLNEMLHRQYIYKKDEYLYDRILVSSQLCWLSGIIILIVSTIVGSSRYFLRGANDVMNIIETIEKYKITFVITAPPVLYEIARTNKERKCDLSSVPFLYAGGGRLSAEGQKLLSDELGIPIVQGYGATEFGIISGSYPDILYGSVGQVIPCAKYRLVDIETQQDINTPHKVGEFRVKTPFFMKGYIGNPKETAESIDEQGYFKSGDLMYFDENKYFFFVDRCKEMLKYKSQQIAPAEVEGLLLTHPGVQDACVLGKEHPQYGDVPTGFVVRSPGSSVTEQELDDLISSQLSDHKRLRGGIIFMDALPRTHSGKIARRELGKLLISRERIVNVG